ncbi:hypothetical protein R6Z07F_019613 [Ovis aries]
MCGVLRRGASLKGKPGIFPNFQPWGWRWGGPPDARRERGPRRSQSAASAPTRATSGLEEGGRSAAAGARRSRGFWKSPLPARVPGPRPFLSADYRNDARARTSLRTQPGGWTRGHQNGRDIAAGGRTPGRRARPGRGPGRPHLGRQVRRRGAARGAPGARGRGARAGRGGRVEGGGVGGRRAPRARGREAISSRRPGRSRAGLLRAAAAAAGRAGGETRSPAGRRGAGAGAGAGQRPGAGRARGPERRGLGGRAALAARAYKSGAAPAGGAAPARPPLCARGVGISQDALPGPRRREEGAEEGGDCGARPRRARVLGRAAAASPGGGAPPGRLQRPDLQSPSRWPSCVGAKFHTGSHGSAGQMLRSFADVIL